MKRPYKNNEERHLQIIKNIQLAHDNAEVAFRRIRLAFEQLAIMPGGIHAGDDKLDNKIGDLQDLLQDQQDKLNEQEEKDARGDKQGGNPGGNGPDAPETPCGALLARYQAAVKTNNTQAIQQAFDAYERCMSTPHPVQHKPGRAEPK